MTKRGRELRAELCAGWERAQSQRDGLNRYDGPLGTAAAAAAEEEVRQGTNAALLRPGFFQSSRWCDKVEGRKNTQVRGGFQMPNNQIQAGWYPDPAGDATTIRYWDGTAWTDQTQFYAYPQQQTIYYGNEPLQPIYAPNQAPVYYAGPGGKDRKGFAKAAMILGIVGVPLACCAYFAIVPGILGVIFGILGIKSSKRGMAIAGIVIGALAIIAGVAMTMLSLDIINDPTKYGLPADYLDQFYDL
jgi:hypothetical protein